MNFLRVNNFILIMLIGASTGFLLSSCSGSNNKSPKPSPATISSPTPSPTYSSPLLEKTGNRISSGPIAAYVKVGAPGLGAKTQISSDISAHKPDRKLRTQE